MLLGLLSTTTGQSVNLRQRHPYSVAPGRWPLFGMKLANRTHIRDTLETDGVDTQYLDQEIAQDVCLMRYRRHVAWALFAARLFILIPLHAL